MWWCVCWGLEYTGRVKTWKLQALLALFMALSAIALSAHATVHVADGVEQCLLCATHAGAPAAACGQPQWPVFTGLSSHFMPNTCREAIPAAECLAPPPRAPPATS